MGTTVNKLYCILAICWGKRSSMFSSRTHTHSGNHVRSWVCRWAWLWWSPRTVHISYTTVYTLNRNSFVNYASVKTDRLRAGRSWYSQGQGESPGQSQDVTWSLSALNPGFLLLSWGHLHKKHVWNVCPKQPRLTSPGPDRDPLGHVQWGIFVLWPLMFSGGLGGRHLTQVGPIEGPSATIWNGS